MGSGERSRERGVGSGGGDLDGGRGTGDWGLVALRNCIRNLDFGL